MIAIGAGMNDSSVSSNQPQAVRAVFSSGNGCGSQSRGQRQNGRWHEGISATEISVIL